MTVPRNTFGDKDVQPGMILGMNVEKEGEEHQVPATVLAANDSEVTVDFNHPLAGQELTYQITLASIDTEQNSPATDCGCGCSSSGGCAPSGGCTPSSGCGCH